jgi:HEPN domain-containing protein
MRRYRKAAFLPELDPTEVAAVLVRKAEGDATVTRKLADDEEIADDAVGFHAQQANERWLKAVIASRGENFEYTHDLRHLIIRAKLEPCEADQPFDLRQAINLTEYAVPLRYEDLLDAEPLDRASTVSLVDEVEQGAKNEIAASTTNRA